MTSNITKSVPPEAIPSSPSQQSSGIWKTLSQVNIGTSSFTLLLLMIMAGYSYNLSDSDKAVDLNTKRVWIFVCTILALLATTFSFIVSIPISMKL